MDQQIIHIGDSLSCIYGLNTFTHMDRDWEITASNQILNDIILVQVVNDGNTI